MQVVLSKDANKHFEPLPRPEQKKIKKKLQLLENDPFTGKKLSGELEAY